VNSSQQKRVKLFSAVIGASAVVAVGAVGVAVANEQAVTGTVGAVPEATLGATTTTTTPPAAPVTSIATPTMTATTPAGFR
jgi:type IV secretory pathway TrbL component